MTVPATATPSAAALASSAIVFALVDYLVDTGVIAEPDSAKIFGNANPGFVARSHADTSDACDLIRAVMKTIAAKG